MLKIGIIKKIERKSRSQEPKLGYKYDILIIFIVE